MEVALGTISRLTCGAMGLAGVETRMYADWMNRQQCKHAMSCDGEKSAEHVTDGYLKQARNQSQVSSKSQPTTK